jgi:hypothetical protein
MAKRKSNAKPPAQTVSVQTGSTKTRRRRKAGSGGSVPAGLVHQICGLTDPFCKHAVGSKYPDDSSLRTLAWSFHGRTIIGSDSNGVGAILLYPSYTYLPFITAATVATNGDITLPGAPVNTATFSGTSLYRIVSCGAKLRNVTAPLSSSGMLHIRSLAQENGAGLNAFNGFSYSRSEAMDIPLQDCKEVCIICPHSSSPPTNFYSSAGATPSTNVEAWSGSGFTPVSIFLSGGPVSVPIAVEVEFWVHYELMFDDTNSMTMLSTPPPPANPVVTGVANMITSSASHLLKRGGELVSEVIKRKAIELLRSRYPMTGALVSYAVEVD